NDFFTIEKSENGIDYRELKTIPGSGNSNLMVVYNFKDEDPHMGNNYYRLKQTDIDGTFHYSSAIAVESKTQEINQFSFGPNPMSDFLNLFYTIENDGAIEIQILSREGFYVYNSKVESMKGLN